MRTCGVCAKDKNESDFYAKPKWECKECVKSRVRKWHFENREKAAAYSREWRKKNLERAKANSKRWVAANHAHVLSRISKWQQENRDKKSNYQRKYRQINSEYYAEKCATRRAVKRTAMPFWANATAIQDLYRQAQELSVATGIKHNVDHIVPLRSKLVCGLHVEHNLRVIPATENFKKNNKVWPDMPVRNGTS